MERDKGETVGNLLKLWVEAPENSNLREEIWKKIQELEKEKTEAKLEKLREEVKTHYINGR